MSKKFTEKHLCQGLFFNKVETVAQMFPCDFCEIFKKTFFTEHLWTTASVCSKIVKRQRRTKLLTCFRKLRVEREKQQT